MEGAYKISCEPKLLRNRILFFFNEQPFWNSQLFGDIYPQNTGKRNYGVIT